LPNRETAAASRWTADSRTCRDVVGARRRAQDRLPAGGRGAGLGLPRTRRVPGWVAQGRGGAGQGMRSAADQEGFEIVGDVRHVSEVRGPGVSLRLYLKMPGPSPSPSPSQLHGTFFRSLSEDPFELIWIFFCAACRWAGGQAGRWVARLSSDRSPRVALPACSRDKLRLASEPLFQGADLVPESALSPIFTREVPAVARASAVWWPPWRGGGQWDARASAVNACTKLLHADFLGSSLIKGLLSRLGNSPLIREIRP